MKNLIYIIFIGLVSASCEVDNIGVVLNDGIDVIYFESDSTEALETATEPITFEINSIKSGNSAVISLGGTAVRDVDYTISNDDLNVIFDEGVHTQTISVSLIDNNLADGNRKIIFSLPSGQGLGENNRREFIINILDDDVPSGTVVSSITEESDDAEEGINGDTPGDMDVTSSDLEFGEVEGSTRGVEMVGLRFNNINIPQGVKITSATIQFVVDETVDNPATVVMDIFGENVDNSSTFTEDPFNISNRPLTTTTVSWNIPIWTEVGLAGDEQKTADISTVIEEIVNRPGWVAGNSLSVIFVPTAATLLNSTESGRVAENGGDELAAVITIDWER